MGVEVFEDYIRVACDDGSSHEGSIVIGADGVHSAVRQHLEVLRSGIKLEDLSTDQRFPYVATYRVCFGSTPSLTLSGLPPNARWDARRDNMCAQIITGSSRVWFSIYEKLTSPASGRSRYSEADKAGVLGRWGDVYIAPGWMIRDISAAQNLEGTGLVNLEEGLVETWSWKRIVLVGDAVRNMEPHLGLGYNCGVADIVVLANELQRLLRGSGASDTKVLENLFVKYQAERREETQTATSLSA